MELLFSMNKNLVHERFLHSNLIVSKWKKVNPFYFTWNSTLRYALIIGFGTFYLAMPLRNLLRRFGIRDQFSVHFLHNVDPINDPEKHEHNFTDLFFLTVSTFYGISSFEKSSGNACMSHVRFCTGISAEINCRCDLCEKNSSCHEQTVPILQQSFRILLRAALYYDSHGK